MLFRCEEQEPFVGVDSRQCSRLVCQLLVDECLTFVKVGFAHLKLSTPTSVLVHNVDVRELILCSRGQTLPHNSDDIDADRKGLQRREKHVSINQGNVVCDTRSPCWPKEHGGVRNNGDQKERGEIFYLFRHLVAPN